MYFIYIKGWIELEFVGNKKGIIGVVATRSQVCTGFH